MNNDDCDERSPEQVNQTQNISINKDREGVIMLDFMMLLCGDNNEQK